MRCAVLCGGATAVAVASLAVMSVRGTGGSPEMEPRTAVALLLYGQDDPDKVTAFGRHGLGGQPVRIRIEQLARCRFAIVAPAGEEVIDFDEVASIRHVLVDDPAAGLARSLGVTKASRDRPRLALAILTGSPTTVCDGHQCSDRRAFALQDARRLDAARTAASEFRRRCPSKGLA